MSAYSIALVHPNSDQALDSTPRDLKSQHVIQVNGDEVILDVALDQEVNLPYTCLNGKCLDCVGQLVQGDVEQTPEAMEFLTRHKIDSSFVLLCCSCPKADCVIVTHQADTLL